MTSRLSTFVSVLAVAVASPITIGAGLVIYEAVSPPESSLVRAIMERYGEGESAQADAAREAEAHYQYRLTQAQEENKRLTAASSRLYDSMGAALQRSFDLEAEVVRVSMGPAMRADVCAMISRASIARCCPPTARTLSPI